MAEKMSAEALERALQIITYWGEGSLHETVVKQLEDHTSALQSEADRLREALEPFAEIARFVDDPTMSDFDTIVIDVEEPTGCAIAKVTWKDFRRARAALSATQQDAG